MAELKLKLNFLGISLLFLSLSAQAGWFGNKGPSIADEEDAFRNSAVFFHQPGKDLTSAYQSFKRYSYKYPQSPKILDAEFLMGEAALEEALDSLKARESREKKSSPGKMLPQKPLDNLLVLRDLSNAEKAYKFVVKRDSKTGLGASAQYRLAELAYDERHWNKAIKSFKDVELHYPHSYIAPEALMGIVFSDLALENYAKAEADLTALGENFPLYLKVPSMLYSQGIIALHEQDYEKAENFLKQVKNADSTYYLGLTYILSKRPYLAASTLDHFETNYPQSPLQEEAHLLMGDAFFLAKDYDGAIAKYQAFLSSYPASSLDAAANYRLGSSFFEKKDYNTALENFRNVFGKYPKSFFAPLAQYFIGEDYLNSNQLRFALFAYTRVATNYPDSSDVVKLARYKIIWTQYHMGNYAEVVQSAQDFLASYPQDKLAKDVSLIEGNAFKKLNRNDDAIAAFQHVIDLAPSSKVAEQALFSILKDEFDQKSYYAIITSYQFIFRHLPPSQSKWRILSYLYAAEAYLSLNRPTEAKDIYKMTLQLYPDSPYALYAQDGLAWAYTYAGEDEKALAARQKLKDMMSLLGSTSSFSGASEMGIADSLFNQRKYEYAYEIYSKFVKNNPQSPELPGVLYHEGLSLYKMRYYTQSVDAWNQLAAQFPKSPEARKASFLAADTLFRAQKYPEAIKLYRRILHDYLDSKKLPLARLRIAQSYFNEQKDEQAVQETEDLIRGFPNAQESLDSLDMLDSIFDRAKDINYKTVLDTIIASAPDSPVAAEATYRLARRAFDEKNYPLAIDYFQKFSVRYTEHPKLAKAQFYLGESYLQLKKYQEAVAPLERFINNFAASNETPIAVFHLASCYYSLKEYQKAAQNYARLLRDFPNSDYEKAAQFNLALTYKDLGESDLAEQAYQDYVKTVGAKSSDGRSAYWEIFDIQKKERDYDNALKTLDQLDASAGDPAQKMEDTYRRGEIYALMARPDEELNVWKKMKEMDPSNNPFRLQALIKLGEMYEKYNDFADAAAAYKDLARSASGGLARQALEKAKEMAAEAKTQGSATSAEAANTAPTAKPADATSPAQMPGMQ